MIDCRKKGRDVKLGQNRATLRKLSIVTFGVMVMLVITQIVTSFVNYSDFAALKQSWLQEFRSPQQKHKVLSKIKSHLGYGGFIHTYKDAILRGETYSLPSVKNDIEKVELLLEEYRQIGVSPEERDALNKIAAVLGKYKNNLALTKELIEYGQSAAIVDWRVRVSDRFALEALNFLEEEIARATNDIQAREESLSDEGLQYAQVSLFALPIFVICTLVFFVLARRINKVVTEEAELSKAVMETQVNPMIVIDDKGIVQQFNNSSARTFGYEPEEVIGNNVKMLMPEPQRTEHDGYLKNYRKTSERKIIGYGREVVAQKKDGTLFPILLAVGEMRLKNKRLYTGGILDLTEIRAAEEKLKLAMQDAEKANMAKTHFLSSMSHELRTPLNSILGFSQLLLASKKNVLNERQIQQVTNIQNAGQHLLDLINEILDLAKIEAGKIEFQIEAFDYLELAEECVAYAQSMVNSKNLNVSVSQLNEDAPLIVADRLRFKQALLNLLSNAVKYNRENGHVWMYSHVSEAGDALRISIVDTGNGISQEDGEKLFEPFNRLGAENSSIEGTGIGLVYTKRLIEEMNGKLGFSSLKNVSSTFWIEIPFAQKEEEAAE